MIALVLSVVLRFDALGYAPGARVWAVLLGDTAAHQYQAIDLDRGRIASQGRIGPVQWRARSLSGSALVGRRLELGALREGHYQIVLDDGTRLPTLRVTTSPERAAVPQLVRFLRAQRCGLVSADVSRHAPCHMQDGALAGGWHDAGDYLKFVGTTAFVLATDAIALRDHPGALGELRGELRWGLDWLLAMLPHHHQVADERDHERGFRRPEDDGDAIRPAIAFQPGRGANLYGRSAAALATASQLFGDDPAYSARLLTAARRTYEAARASRSPQQPQPADFYFERSVEDDLALGAIELFRATGEAHFRDEALAHARALEARPGTPLSWGNVEALALAETALAFPDGSPERIELTRRLVRMAAPIAATFAHARGPAAVFRYALPSFGNGSIAESLGAAATCLLALRAGGDPACVEVARSQLHWLWGQNPFGLSFQIGLGEHFPRHPHHSLPHAIDGAIVGGPTALHELRKSGPFARFSTADLFYEDDPENWIVNEPAIDFTAPLAFVIGELSP
jgi:hypothetical protein